MLDFLKDLWGENSFTREQLEAELTEQGKDKFNIVNLAEGNYVSKAKYESDLLNKDTQIKSLNESIDTRDKDLKELKKQLEKAGTDANSLSELQTKFDDLKKSYDADKKKFEEDTAKIKYEADAREFASQFEFTSPAAKRDFINQLINKGLTMEDGKIVGKDDFYNSYKAENEASFVVEKKVETKQTQPAPELIVRNNQPAPEHKLTLSEQMRLANEQQK